ncbi:MAG: tetratricopeptide repeat protein, partial [Sideroxydans sp.]
EIVAKKVASEEANTTSKAEVKKWFDDNLALVNQEIDALKIKVKQKTEEVESHVEQAHRNIDIKVAEIIEKVRLSSDSKSELTEADKQTLSQANKSLQDKPESQYTFEDWNTRAHAFYAENKLALAFEYWVKAAEARDASDQQIAQAIYNQGVAQGQQGKTEDAIDNYSRVVQRFGDATSPVLQELVAMALVYQGVALGKQGKPAEEIACYKQVVKRFGDSTWPALQELVAQAIYNQGLTLSKQDKPDEEIACYKQLVKRFGDSTWPALQELVAQAIYNQGLTQDKQGRSVEAIDCFRQVVKRFGDSTQATLQELVAVALNGHGFSVLIQAKRLWDKEAERTQLLSESLVLYERSKAITQENEMKAIVLGNVAYALWLLGRRADVEAPLREALTLGGEEIFKVEIEDTKISPVPVDSGFEQLVTRLWSEVSSKC